MQSPFETRFPWWLNAKAVITYEWPDNIECKLAGVTPKHTRIFTKSYRFTSFSQRYIDQDFILASFSVHTNKEITIKWIVHEGYMLFYYQMQGSCIIKYNGITQPLVIKEHQYKAGYIAPRHHTLTYKPGQHHTLYFIQKPVCFVRFALQFPILSPLIDLVKQQSGKTTLLPLCPVDFTVYRLITELENCRRTPDFLRLKVLGIMAKMMETYEQQLLSGKVVKEKEVVLLMQEIKEYIISTVSKGPRQPIAAIARKFNMSERTLRRNFHNVHGISLKKFKLNERMNVARRMREMGTPIAEIADKLGYSSISTLGREYRKHFGEWP